MCFPVTEQVQEEMDIFNNALAEPLPAAVDPLLMESLLCSKETRRNHSGKLKTSLTLPSSGLYVDSSLNKIHLPEPAQELPSVEHFIGNIQKCRESQRLASVMYESVVVCSFGLEGVTALGNYLVLTFMDCGGIDNAQQVFNRLPLQGELICTSLLHGYIELEQWHQALLLFDKVRTDFEGSSPPLLVVLLQACAQQRWVKRGQELHTQAVMQEFERDLKVGTALVDMYAKCGAVSEAQDVFDDLLDRDVVLWTALIGGYAEHGFCEEALGCLDCMQKHGVPVNAVTYVCSLKACGGLGDVARGLKLHAELSRDGLERNLHVCSTLVDMYAEFGLLVEARRVLDKLLVRNVVSWNALVTGYVEHGLMDKALGCLEHMQAEGISPNAITLVCSLKGCCSLGAVEKGQWLHATINKMGYENDIYLGSILIDMYATWGFLEDAQDVFRHLPYCDVVAWTALIRGYIGQGFTEEAFSCLEQMRREGIRPNAVTYACSLKACSSQGSIEKARVLHSQIAQEGLEKDTFVGNTLVDMYAKCGRITEAVEVFDELRFKSVVSWNAVITAYTEYGFFEEALFCLRQMELELISPDAITCICCLKACGSVGAMEKGREIHMKIIKEGFEKDPYLSGSLTVVDTHKLGLFQSYSAASQEAVVLALANAVIDLYGKCGSMIDSQKVFDETPVKDICTWTALVSGYSRKGEFKLVFSLFERMEREAIKPDGVIFLGLLNVCSHVGLMDKGHMYFDMMKTYGIDKTIEHHNCMIDLYGRAGILERALLVLDRMPFEPDFISWSTMLCACRRWGQRELGRQAFECVMKVREGNAAWFIAMSNMYAASQMSEE